MYAKNLDVICLFWDTDGLCGPKFSSSSLSSFVTPCIPLCLPLSFSALLILHFMVKHAKSQTKKAQIQSEEKEELIQLAVAAYRAELKKLKDDCKGARTVCKEVADEHRRKTGREVRVDHNTMLCRFNGGKSHTESHAEKSWLSSDEVETIICFAEELSDRGIPLTLKTLEEHVNFILRARLGGIFTGVGKNWTARFVEKHSDRHSQDVL